MSKRNHFKHAAKKKYHEKNQKQKNPYFQTKRKLPLKPLLAATGCLVFVIVGMLFLLGSQRFEIDNITITGLEHIDPIELEPIIADYLNDSAWLFWSKSNMFLFKTGELSESISTRFTFADVSVSSSGNDLHLAITERTANLLWVVGDVYFVADLEGVLVRQLSQEETSVIQSGGDDGGLIGDLPIFTDRNEINVAIGDRVLTDEEIDGVFSFHEHLTSHKIDFDQTIFDRLAGKWVSVETKQGYSILFDPTEGIGEQSARLQSLLSSLEKGTEDLEYIDLRFGEHVYYK